MLYGAISIEVRISKVVGAYLIDNSVYIFNNIVINTKTSDLKKEKALGK